MLFIKKIQTPYIVLLLAQTKCADHIWTSAGFRFLRKTALEIQGGAQGFQPIRREDGALRDLAGWGAFIVLYTGTRTAFVVDNMAEQRDKLPIPRLPTRPKPPKKPKLIDEAKAAAIEQKKEAKKQSKKARDKTRIYIGEALQRWNDLKEQKGLKTNAEVAFLLLDL